MKPRVLALTAALCSLPVTATAQAVPRAPGSTFVSVSQSYYSSTQYVDANGNRQPNGCDFQKSATTLYAEHGFNPRDTGSVQFEYDDDRCGNATTSGLNDVQLAFLHQVHRSATTSLGWKAQVLVPTGYDIGANPRIGYGRVGGQFGYVYGGGFRDIGGYGFYSIESGVRAYIGYPAPQFRTFGTVGSDLGPYLQLMAQLEWNQSLGAGQTLTYVGLNPTIFPKFSDVAGIVTLRVKLTPHLSLVGSTSGVFYGRDYGIGSTSAIGIWSDF